MKRIKVETIDKIYYAKPLTLSQLEENEELLNQITEEAYSAQNEQKNKVPIGLIRQQASVVLLGLRNHKPDLEDVTGTFSLNEIAQSFALVMSGSGLVEVPEKNELPGA